MKPVCSMQCGNAKPVATIIVQVGIFASFARKRFRRRAARQRARHRRKRNCTVTTGDREASDNHETTRLKPPNRFFARRTYQTISSTVIGKWSEYPSRSAPWLVEGRLNLRGRPLDAFNTAGLNMATLSSFALTGLAVRNMP